MQVAEAAKTLVAQWSKLGLVANAGVSPGELHDFEKRERLELPPDICEYFLLANGLCKTSREPELFSFWSLGELVRVSKRHADVSLVGGISYLVFADVFISSIEFAFACAPVSTIVAIAPPKIGGIAQTFAEFVELYVENNSALSSPFD
jgi:hypothetical protein